MFKRKKTQGDKTMNDCKCIGKLPKSNFETYMNVINEIQLQCYQELENYLCYMMRCLLRTGQQWDNDKITVVTFEKTSGVSQGVVYPASSVIDGQGIVNPAFFYGYYIGHDMNDKYKFKILITEDYRLLQNIP